MPTEIIYSQDGKDRPIEFVPTYSIETTVEAEIERFVKRYGYEPKRAIVFKGYVYIQQKEEK